MARPANANPHETKRRLVDVALLHFAEHGFHGALATDIAEEAGFTLGTVNHYFHDKQGLYDAVVDEVYRRLGARAAEALAGVDVAGIRTMMSLLYSVARAERDGVRVLVRQVLDHGRLTAHTEARHFLPEIEKAAQLTARIANVTAEQARTAAVTIGYLLSRFVIQDERSLMAAFGVRSAKEAHARVVATLTTTAQALFAPQEHDR